MAEFASTSTNIAAISDTDFAAGFGSCVANGMPVDTAHLNGVIQRLCSMFVVSIQEGSFITVDATDPNNPIVGVDSLGLASDVDFVQALDNVLPYPAITNVELSGNNLVFTGVNGAFSGAVDLSSFAGGGGGAFASEAITIIGGGLATGGGDLTANRTITVTAASDVETLAMANSAVALTPTNLAAYFDRWQPRAGQFTVDFNGVGSGSVTFANAFPAGVVPHIALSDYSNRDGGDSDDEEIWITGRTNTGFSWETRGDGPIVNFGYVASPPY